MCGCHRQLMDHGYNTSLVKWTTRCYVLSLLYLAELMQANLTKLMVMVLAMAPHCKPPDCWPQGEPVKSGMIGAHDPEAIVTWNHGYGRWRGAPLTVPLMEQRCARSSTSTCEWRVMSLPPDHPATTCNLLWTDLHFSGGASKRRVMEWLFFACLNDRFRE
jgi:hypothetical protein